MKKRAIYLLAILVMITQFAVAQDYYIKSNSGLNMRSGPGTSHNVVKTVPGGAEVEIINKENDDWWEIEYEGAKGYVAAKYLTSDEGEAEKSKAEYKKGASSGTGSKSKPSKSTTSGGDKNWGLGLRFGDPAGISIKRYMDDGKAFELNVGRTAIWGFGRYRDRFDDVELDHLYYEYDDYNIRSAFAIQLHNLYHKNVSDISGLEDLKRLQWYYGFGGQVRIISAVYDYRYGHDHDPDPDDWDNHWHYDKEKVTDLDFGVDGVVGLEYTFANIPVSIFLDLNLFVELYDNPMAMWFQSGIGGRYNF